jgi:aspartate/methionine/tyrosine aminotransferase
MNQIASQLNKTLEGTVALDLFSALGTRFYFPKGIVAQSAEATKHAHRFTATVGEARNNKKAMYLESIRKHVPDLDPDDIFPYVGTAGIPELRDLWKKEMLEKNPDLGSKLLSNPIVVPGITSGIVMLADLFINPGDTVIVPDMAWDNYKLIFETKNEATIVSPAFFNQQGKLNTTGLKDAILTKSRENKCILILNFPNNPTGYSPTSEDVEGIKSALLECASKGIKLLVLIDDSYFGLFFEKNIFPQSVFSQISHLHPNILSIKLDGATKEDFSWGLRVGFVTYGSHSFTQEHYAAIEQKTMGIIRATISNSPRLSQTLVALAMKSPTYKAEKEANFKILTQKYAKVKEIIAKSKSTAITALPFNSGYFMCFKMEKISAEKLRQYLLFEKGIGTISIDDEYLRIAFSSVETADMEPLFAEIFAAADKLANQ